jgi:hypothetical protein
MQKLKKILILQIDKKNLNGNLYTKEAVEDMVYKIGVKENE